MPLEVSEVSNPVQTVQSIYESFHRGDIPAILGQLADDVRWEEWDDHHGQRAGVPWLTARNGKDAVPGFFEVVGRFQFHEFRVLTLMSGGNQVAAEVIIDATVPSGKRVRDEEIHLWTFNAEGKVSRFRHYVDTAKHIAAV